MLILDKSKITENLFLTFDDTTIDSIILQVISGFTNKTLSINLTNNTSYHPLRYAEFEVNTSLFDEFDEGLYVYKAIKNNNVIKTGYLKIVNSNKPDPFKELDQINTEFITIKNFNDNYVYIDPYNI